MTVLGGPVQWAVFGLCVLALLFSLYSLRQTIRVERRVRRWRESLEEAEAQMWQPDPPRPSSSVPVILDAQRKESHAGRQSEP